MGKIVRLASAGVVALLVGCSALSASVAESERAGGLPAEAITATPGPQSKTPSYPFPEAGWLDGGAKFALVLSGSSTCPSFPSSIEVINMHHMKIGVSTRGGSKCSADIAPRTYVIRTPGNVDTSREVTLQYGETSVLLPSL
jgi:hypothetical protein